MESLILIEISTWLYISIILLFVLRTLFIYIKQRQFNIPKNAIIIGTILSWYFGIVHFNNDLIFTLLNVVSHGIPYIALIYINEIERKNSDELGILRNLKSFKGLILFLLFILVIAFFEEYLWEILIWKEQYSISNLDLTNWQFLLIPLLTVPQFTHYLLDGFIWKTKQN